MDSTYPFVWIPRATSFQEYLNFTEFRSGISGYSYYRIPSVYIIAGTISVKTCTKNPHLRGIEFSEISVKGKTVYRHRHCNTRRIGCSNTEKLCELYETIRVLNPQSGSLDRQKKNKQERLMKFASNSTTPQADDMIEATQRIQGADVVSQQTKRSRKLSRYVQCLPSR